jgi:mRNA-degrading endonuclease RelE of RelBE toxin-antitoxin system
MPNQTPPTKIYESISYKKELKKLSKRYRSIDRDIKPLIEQLASGENPGDRVVGNEYPVYKVRVPNSDTRKGKSGGYQFIYYVITTAAILLTTIYAKSDRGNISNKEIEDMIGEYKLEIDAFDEKLSEQEPKIINSEDSNLES